MHAALIYLAILMIAGLAIVLNLVIVYGKNKKRISRLSGVAFAFVVAGLFLGGQNLTGYCLAGIGFMLAIIDIFRETHSEEIL